MATVKELQKTAAALGIEGRSGMNKAELEKAIEAFDGLAEEEELYEERAEAHGTSVEDEEDQSEFTRGQ